MAASGQGFDYLYDDIGNRVSTVRNNEPLARTSAYTANSLNQYTQRTVPGYLDILGSAETGAVVTVDNQSVTRQDEYFHKELTVDNSAAAVFEDISVVGAALNAGTGGIDVVSVETGMLSLAQTPEAFVYDTDGNLLSDGLWTNTWNGENRLVSMESLSVVPDAHRKRLELSYDYAGRRYQKILCDAYNGSAYAITNTSTYLYDGWNLIAERLTDSTTPTVSTNYYIWGLDMSGSLQGAGGIAGLLILEIDDTNYFPCYDGNGNVMQLVDASDGSVAAAYEYDPYGNVISKTGAAADDNPFRFSTKYWDDESGLGYWGYRYYHPGVGRWLNRDPIEERGGLNLYGFVGNRPVGQWDYLGLERFGESYGSWSGVSTVHQWYENRRVTVGNEYRNRRESTSYGERYVWIGCDCLKIWNSKTIADKVRVTRTYGDLYRRTRSARAAGIDDGLSASAVMVGLMSGVGSALTAESVGAFVASLAYGGDDPLSITLAAGGHALSGADWIFSGWSNPSLVDRRVLFDTDEQVMNRGVTLDVNLWGAIVDDSLCSGARRTRATRSTYNFVNDPWWGRP